MMIELSTTEVKSLLWCVQAVTAAYSGGMGPDTSGIDSAAAKLSNELRSTGHHVPADLSRAGDLR
jgi:hypothetical protein